MPTLKAGIAEVVITPPVGVDMTGFGSRTFGCLGIHDDLYARALVLEAGGRRACVVTTDLLSLDFDLVAAVRTESVSRFGIRPEHLLLNSSHTHSGPAAITLRGLGKPDPDYMDILRQKILGAMSVAVSKLAGGRVAYGQEAVQIGYNRRQRTPDGRVILGRNPDAPVCKVVEVLRVETTEGAPLGALYSHAAHPVTLGGNNMLITADYPGYAAVTLKKAYGEAFVPMFAQGSCGDINSNPVGGTFNDAKRLGVRLAGAAMKAVEKAEPVRVSEITGQLRKVELHLGPPPSVEEAQAQARHCRELFNEALANTTVGYPALGKGQLEWAEEVLRLAYEGERERTRSFEIQTLHLGDMALVGWPAETFFVLGEAVKARSKAKPTLVFGYSNGCLCYLPSAEEHALGGYEVESSMQCYGTLPLRSDAGDVVVQATVEMLNA